MIIRETMKGRLRRCLIAGILLLAVMFSALPVQANTVKININVGVKAKNPPYQFMQGEEVAGLNVDLMDAIGDRVGLNITYIPFDSTDGILEALRSGEIDVILGSSSGHQYGNVTKTNTLSSGTISLIMPNDLAKNYTGESSSLKRFSLAMEFGTVSLTRLGQLRRIRETIVAGDQTQLYDDLIGAKVDAVAAVKESFLYQLKETGDDKLINSFTVVNNYMDTVNYVLLVRSSDVMLEQRLNRGISELRNGKTYEKLVTQWIADEELAMAERRISTLLKAIALLLLIALGGFALISGWNRRLKQLVREKTEEIQQQMIQLEASGRLRSLLIQNFPNSILLLRADGQVLLMNPNAESLAKRDHIDWDAPHEAVYIDQVDRFREIWTLTRDDTAKEMDGSEVISIRLDDGRDKVARYQYFPLNSANDCVLMVEDVTDEENRRQAMYEKEKNVTLNRLIAGIAHEIKNPLMTIQAFASIIRDQGDDEEFQESFATYVPQEVNRINRLVESLINYAKPVKGTKEVVDVKTLTDECVYLVSASAKGKHVNFVCENDLAVNILVNRDQIKQTLLNLLINSVESVGERAEREPAGKFNITVRVTKETDGIWIAIRDEGTGMTEESIRYCTEPFYTTKATGTGMGLSLGRQFVAENGGEFTIASELGEYTEIGMRFPEVKSEEEQL